jgi:AraC family transcriptional regulator of adaptative response/methylated-DNA-[protein]-cysteine methyltransferase
MMAPLPRRSPDLPQNASPNADPRWALLAARDPAADGQFWYGVSSTGVYCRPSCPSRAAKPANVTFFDSLEPPATPVSAPAAAATPTGWRWPSSTPRWSSRPAA